MTAISILHISDMHKDDSASYGNLMEALKADCHNYTKNRGIKKPNVVVVSGDIIRGGTDKEIEEQYAESTGFLEEIVSYFLDGDKSRIIIVPGNHDVDWNISRASMEKENRSTQQILDIYFSDISDIRWSWAEMSFCRIADRELYQSRLGHFMDFYNSFYGGSRTFSTHSDEQFQIYDIPQFDIVLVGFNSCYNNDHLRFAGMINPECITKASQELRDLHEKGRLLIGVWHHNTSGRPFESNYLDNRVLHAMIDRDIQIGLHGHQHICGAVSEVKNVFEDKRMVILSAGTLFGNKGSLPRGTSRQYNLIEIATKEEDAEYRITVHSREDISSDLFDIPSWGEGRIDKQPHSSWSFDIPRPPRPNIEIAISNIMKETEATGDFRSAIGPLMDLNENEPLVRKVLVDYLDRVQDPALICNTLTDPQNAGEAVMLLYAASELGNVEQIEKVINIPLIKESTDAAIKKMRQSLTIKRK